MTTPRLLGALRKFARDRYYSLHAHDMESYSQWLYRRKTGRELDIDHPRDLNEWIAWLQFRTDTSVWTRLADKYTVRQFVSDHGYGHMLPHLYGVWDDAAEIDFRSLPDRYILKATHGSAMSIIVPEAGDLDIRQTRRTLSSWLRTPFGRLTAEPHYLSIPRRIIAEELLDKDRQSFQSSSLIDYKIWCIHGAPQYICVYHDRRGESVVKSIHDLNWNLRPELGQDTATIHQGKTPLPRPRSLDTMLRCATGLSQGFPQVRVDFYEVNGTPYFGEMTFTGGGGRMTSFSREFLASMGQLIGQKM